MISSFIADTMENSEALGFCFEPFSGQPHVGVGSRDLGPFRRLPPKNMDGESHRACRVLRLSSSFSLGFPELTGYFSHYWGVGGV